MKLKKLYLKINPLPSVLRFISRKRLKNRDVTILSMNCLGGIVYHNLNLKFLSPTINLRFESVMQFYRFCSNLNYYLSLPLEEIPSDEDFPVVRLGDIIINMVHYKSFDIAVEKWEERKKRINFDNIYIIANDYVTDDKTLSNDEIIAFGNLPYKVTVLCQDRHDDLPYTHYLGAKKLRKVMNRNFMGLYGYELSFDVVKFLNS